MLVRTFIAFPHFLNLDDLDSAVPVEQDPVIADAEPVVVLVTGQRFHALAIWRHESPLDTAGRVFSIVLPLSGST
jgi:hypothetical protein